MGDRLEDNKRNCTCGVHWELRNVHKSLVGIPQENRPLTRPSPKWEGCVKAGPIGRECGLIKMTPNTTLQRTLMKTD